MTADKRWPAYERHLLSGLWHVHTDRTDGHDDVETLVDFAVRNAFPLLGVVEHVRERIDYDFEALAEAVDRAAPPELRCVVGCEAKVLDTDGSLDYSPEIRERADVVYAAYHGTAFSPSEYERSVRATLRNPAVDVWAHPFSYPRRRGFEVDRDTRAAFGRLAAENDVLVELNLGRPHPWVEDLTAAGARRIVGYDLHDTDAWE